MNETSIEYVGKLLEEGRAEEVLAIREEWVTEEAWGLINRIHGYFQRHNRLPTKRIIEREFGMEFTPDLHLEYLKDEYEKERFARVFESRINNRVVQAVRDNDKARVIGLLSDLAHELDGFDQSTVRISRRQMIESTIDRMRERRLSNGTLGIRTPWGTLTTLLRGWRRKCFYPLVGRPKMGKTQLALVCAEEAYQAGEVVLYISMEMAEEEMSDRETGLVGGISTNDLMLGHLTTVGEYVLRQKLITDTRNENDFIFIEGMFNMTTGQVGYLISRYRPTFVVLDGAYLTKYPEAPAKWAKWERETEKAAIFKALAARYNVPFLATYQLKRGARRGEEGSGSEGIMFSDAIGQIASATIELHRHQDNRRQRRVTVSENRNGPPGEIVIEWDFNTNQYTEVSSSIEESLADALAEELQNEQEG